MRIAEINDIASVASDLAKGLRDRGHSVTVIQPRLFGGGLPWMVKPVVGPVRGVEWAQIIRQVHEGNFDIVHIHYAYLGMLGILGKFPYILHCHGSDVREITPFTRPMIQRSLRHAGKVFYATPDLGTYVRSHRPDAEFLPNPVDSETFRPLSPIGQPGTVFICCGLTDIKGAPRLLDACRRLAESRPDIRITAISGGDYTPQFAALPNVTLIPHQHRSRLPELISQHEVVMGQVLLGVVGMAELEAMACARPVVSWYTYRGAYAEFPPFARAVDGYDIAATVARLVDDSAERQAIGEASRGWVQKFHNIAEAAERVERAALDVISGNSQRVRSSQA